MPFSGSAASQLPFGAQPSNVVSGNQAAAACVCTVFATTNRTTYIQGFEFMGLGATGASVVTVTVVGTQGGTRLYLVSVPAGATLACSPFPLAVQFNPPLPAANPNTNIVVTVPSLGAGNTTAALNVGAYYL